jgi:Tfp pilus assembly protein PilF
MKKISLTIVLMIAVFFSCLANSRAEKMTLIDANKIIGDLKAEIKQKPNDIGARIELGGTYFYLQEYELAKKEFENIITIDNKNAIAHYNLGKTLIMMKQIGMG